MASLVMGGWRSELVKTLNAFGYPDSENLLYIASIEMVMLQNPLFSRHRMIHPLPAMSIHIGAFKIIREFFFASLRAIKTHDFVHWNKN